MIKPVYIFLVESCENKVLIYTKGGKPFDIETQCSVPS